MLTGLAAAAVTAVLGGALLVHGLSDGSAVLPPAPVGATNRLEQTPRPEGHHSVDPGDHSTTDPASIWVIVNKSHPIQPFDFRPEIAIVRGYQVAAPVAAPLEQLLAASDAEGLGFKIASAFRSYDYQLGVHADLVAARGAAQADRVSARAGYSEHQTGLAVDLVTPADPGCDFEECFADTPAGRWLVREAWRFGFVVRYQPGSTAITGYAPEPWHLRFVGRALAADLHRTRIATLEEFFGVAGGDYPAQTPNDH